MSPGTTSPVGCTPADAQSVPPRLDCSAVVRTQGYTVEFWPGRKVWTWCRASARGVSNSQRKSVVQGQGRFDLPAILRKEINAGVAHIFALCGTLRVAVIQSQQIARIIIVVEEREFSVVLLKVNWPLTL